MLIAEFADVNQLYLLVIVAWLIRCDMYTECAVFVYVCVLQNAGVVVITDGYLHEAEYRRKNFTHMLCI